MGSSFIAGKRVTAARALAAAFALLLLFAALVCASPAKAFAAVQDGFSYTVETGDYGQGAYVTGYDTTLGTTPVVPATLGDAPVVSVVLSDEGLTTLNVKAATSLKNLDCSFNNLKKLDVSANTALVDLDCTMNNLSSLSVSTNTSLLTLKCGANALSKLDVTANTKLTTLQCDTNAKLSALDVSANTKLTDLNCASCCLTALDVTKCTSLTKLTCNDNQITALDVSKNKKLTNLSCDNNKLTALDVTANTALVDLFCHDNAIGTLDITKCTSLEVVKCDNNKLVALDISNCPNLKVIACASNYILETDAIAARADEGCDVTYGSQGLPHDLFTDLDSSAWYVSKNGGAFSDGTLYLDFAVARGTMSGYSGSTLFGPNDNVTRAQFATMLFRYACPDQAYQTKDAASYATKNTTGLPDVEKGQYYTAAVNWAVENGIITGYKDGSGNYTSFGPNDKITREQLATMVYRFCTVYKGLPDAQGSISFPDASSISSWALSGVKYCYAKGIVSGDSTTRRFNPGESAQRCAAAKMLAVTIRDVVEG